MGFPRDQVVQALSLVPSLDVNTLCLCAHLACLVCVCVCGLFLCVFACVYFVVMCFMFVCMVCVCMYVFTGE